MAKKKNGKQTQQQLSPEQFIKQKARNLPIETCYISKDIEEAGEGIIIVVRRHPNNKFTLACFLLDIFCLGVKDTFYRVRLDELEYEEILDDYKLVELKEITYNEAHNWIYGAIAFAEEAGIAPHKDFNVTQYILEEDTEDIPLIEYDYGKDGKHFLVAKNQLELSRYLPVLKKNLGDDFDYIIKDNDDYEDYDDYEEMEDEEFDNFDREELLTRLENMENNFLFKEYGPSTEYTYQHPTYPSTLNITYPWLDEMFSSPQNSSGLTKEQIDSVLALPKDILRHDLEQIILYRIGQTYNITEDDLDNERLGIPITHALFFLGEVGNEESLDIVFEVLRQSSIFNEFHFDYTDEDVFIPVLYKLGQNQLNKMMSFAKEKGLYTYSHCLVFPAVAYIAYKQPDRLKEIIEWFREILLFAIEKLPETQYMDSTLVGLLISDILDLQAVELLPEIKMAFETGLVDLSCCGDYNEVEEEMKNPFYPHYWEEYPFDIYKQYEEYRKKWGA